MRRLLLSLLLLTLSSAGCQLNAKYVEADRATYDYLNGKIRQLLAADVLRGDQRILDEDEHEDVDIKLRTWELRLKKAEKFLEVEKPKPDPMWEGW